MITYDPRFRAFAMFLSAVAGFVDAAGFVLTGGLFVSFMSGNSTRLAVGLVDGANVALFAAALVASFVLGVVAGALLAPWKPAWRKTLVCALSSLVLVLSAGTMGVGFVVAASLLLAFAMGSLNNVFLRDGEVSIGVTYMTGALVRAGQRVAGALRRENPSDWLSYILLWASLVIGAIAGAFVAALDLSLSIYLAAGLAVVMTLFAHLLESARQT